MRRPSALTGLSRAMLPMSWAFLGGLLRTRPFSSLLPTRGRLQRGQQCKEDNSKGPSTKIKCSHVLLSNSRCHIPLAVSAKRVIAAKPTKPIKMVLSLLTHVPMGSKKTYWWHKRHDVMELKRPEILILLSLRDCCALCSKPVPTMISHKTIVYQARLRI